MLFAVGTLDGRRRPDALSLAIFRVYHGGSIGIDARRIGMDGGEAQCALHLIAHIQRIEERRRRSGGAVRNRIGKRQRAQNRALRRPAYGGLPFKHHQRIFVGEMPLHIRVSRAGGGHVGYGFLRPARILQAENGLQQPGVAMTG